MEDKKAASTAAKGSDEQDEKKPEETVGVPFAELLRTADALDWVLMFVGSVGAACTGAVQPCFTLIFGALVNALNDPTHTMTEVLEPVILWFCWLSIAAFGVAYLEISCWEVTSQRQANRIRRQYLASLVRQDIAFFDEKDSGLLLNNVVSDCNAIQEALSSKMAVFLQHVASGLVGAAIGLWRGWKMALVMLSLMPLLGLSGALLGIAIQKAQKGSSSAYAEASAFSKETLAQMRVIAAYGAEERFFKQYAALLGPTAASTAAAALGAGFSIGILWLVMFGTYGLALWYGSTLLVAGEYTGGQIMNVLFAIIIAGFEAGQAAPTMTTFRAAKVAGANAFRVMDRRPTIEQNSPTGEKPAQVAGAVELKAVTFAYPARPAVTVLNGLTLSIPTSSHMALVGSSGSGKSTVIQLLQRFYDPQSGGIFLDGRDIRQLNLTWLRQQMGLVSQEPSLFATTIYNNIMYGREGATKEEVDAAVAAANAKDFIEKLPEGYQTTVGERGVQLSGGQKQRVAIARAVLRNPRVLLLDEATSALDSESERLVQNALDRLMLGRTSIVIAHRLSTIRKADCIAVIKKGEVVEQGTHQQLADKRVGHYAGLLEAQAVEPEAAAGPEASRSGTALAGAGWAAAVEVAGAAGAESEPVGVQLKEIGAGSRHAKAGDKGKKEAKEKEKKAAAKVGFMRLWPLASEKAHLLPVGILGSICVGAVMPCFALALASIISAFFISKVEVVNGQAMFVSDFDAISKEVSKWCLIFMAIAVGSFCASIAQAWALGVMGATLAKNAREATFRKILRMEVAWFDDDANSSGRLATKLEEDAGNIRGAVGDQIAVIVQNLTVLAVGLIIAFANSWKLTLVILACLPLLMVGITAQMQAIAGFDSKTEELYAHTKQLVADALGNMRTVAAYGLDTQMVELYTEAQSGPRATQLKRANTQGAGFAFGQSMIMLLYAISFWYGGRLVDAHEISAGAVFKCFFAVVFLGMGFSQAAIAFPTIGKASDAVASIFGILDRPSEIDPLAPEGAAPPGEPAGALTLQGVTFRYPSRPTAVILNSITLEVPARHSMALVGSSGSGKSTIVLLLQRFYNPSEGSIYLDGTELRQLNLRWLRQQMGLVSQEPALFSTTIYNNIMYGREGATEEEMRAAAAAANAAEFIEKLPEGYQTAVGERGVQLSGGQKQRVAIARAVLRNPRVLLLDEATSALDSESERLVQNALDSLMLGRTSIVIAHRLSTIRKSDCIAVINKGEVVEQGTHQQLLKTGGRYAELHQLQYGGGAGRGDASAAFSSNASLDKMGSTDEKK